MNDARSTVLGKGDEVSSSPSWGELMLLTKCPMSKIGTVAVPTQLAIAFEQVFAEIDRTVSRCLDRDLVCTRLSQPASDERITEAFALVFRCSMFDGPCSIILDHVAARAVVDAVSRNLCRTFGEGPLTDVECGLLEYVTLDGIDRLAKNGYAGSQFEIVRFCGPRELPGLDGELDENAVDFSLLLSGRMGRVRFHHGRVNSQAASWHALSDLSPNSDLDVDQIIHLHLAVPPIALDRVEYECLSVGDVIVSGHCSLETFAGGGRVVTAGGWQLSHAQWMAESATMVSVRCGRFHLKSRWDYPHDGSDDSVVLHPQVGQLEVSLDRLACWEEGTTLDFAKDRSAPVRLLSKDDIIGTAELVQVDGEVGIRLLSLKNAKCDERDSA